MKKPIFIFVILVLTYSLSNSIIKAQDTLFISPKLGFSNNALKFTDDLNKIELENIMGFTSGYLVIQIDSNTTTEQIYESGNVYNTFYPTIFWIQSNRYELSNNVLIDSALEDIKSEKYRLYEYSYDYLVSEGYRKFLSGFKDDLSTYLYYYYIYKNDNCYKVGDWLRKIFVNDSLRFKTIWTKDDNKINYIIFSMSFNASILKQKEQDKKFLMPISCLFNFSDCNQEMLIKHGFNKSKKVLIVK